MCFSAGSVRKIALLYWDNNIYINIGCKIKSPRKAKVTRSPGKSNPSVASSQKSSSPRKATGGKSNPSVASSKKSSSPRKATGGKSNPSVASSKKSIATFWFQKADLHLQVPKKLRKEALRYVR